jgi:ATP/maltotriose-dependent transcriptional regulator MalT
MGVPFPSGPKGPGAAAAGELVDELRVLARERHTRTVVLQQAIERVSDSTLEESARIVVEQAPLVAAADLATLRVADEEARLHLVAASGCAASEVRTRALEPLAVEQVRTMTESDLLTRHAATLGIRWLELFWLGRSERPVGTLLVAARTERRPQPSQLALLRRLVDMLGERLRRVTRTSAALRARAFQIARSAEPSALGLGSDPAVGRLRRRERTVQVLELFADGFSTDQVAKLLFISPETVRTHVKFARRTLGVHTREDAVRLVRTNVILQLP